MTDQTISTPRPKTTRHNSEYTFGPEYHMMLTNHYGEVRRYMVRRNLINENWGWDVYVISHEDEYKWVEVIDQMGSRDSAIKCAVADSMSHGITTIFASQIEWA